ncbi:MAG: hypothetical protein R3Y50_07380 [Rikenellaceae bacterium]
MDDNIFYHNDLNDTLYCVDKTGKLKEKIYFDFGSRQVLEKDKIELEQKIEIDKLFKKYTTLSTFCCEDKNYIFGGLYDEMILKTFVVDKANETLYLCKSGASEPLDEVLGFDGKYLISAIDYSAYKDNKDYYPEAVAKALKEEKSVICLMFND